MSEFILQLFPADSNLTIRPTETWTDGGKKTSRVDFKGVVTLTVDADLEQQLRCVYDRADQERTNVFFGVCPRFGVGKYEKAWQIRTVTCLWADDDSGDLPTVRQKIEASGLPMPSIIVATGRGHHFYWLLDTPFLIDDTSNPPPIESDWTEIGGKRKRLEFFVDQYGEKIWLHDPKTGRPIKANEPSLSPKAQMIQDINAGIASAIGSDRTHDLARLLRIPGPPNRKDVRNGVEPKPTAVIETNNQRFSIDQFRRFAENSPEKQSRDKVASMPLPKVRKMTTARSDKLAERVAHCAVADDRSRADFSLCCWAIEQGVDAEEVWREVAHVGKFADRDRGYFDLTWRKAAGHTRQKKFDDISREDVPIVDGPIVYNPTTMPVGKLFDDVTQTLVDSGQVFTRARQAVRAVGDRLTPMIDQSTMAAVLRSERELIIEYDKRREFTLLPPRYANPWLCDAAQLAKLPAVTCYTRCPIFRLTSTGSGLAPSGFDLESGIFYAGPAIKPMMTTEHLDAVLREFCWRSVADRTNFMSLMLTLTLMPRFIGTHPGLIANGNQPILGKTWLAQILAILQGGREVSTVTYTVDDTELEKRIGAKIRSGVQTVIIDNCKTGGQEISSAVLERMMTDSDLSFRLLGESSEICCENSLMLAITANDAKVGSDLLSRCVPVNLHYEGDPKQRSFSIPDLMGYVEQHRLEILAELLGLVQRWIDGGCPLSKASTRFGSKGWAGVIGGILEVSGDPDFLANVAEVEQEMVTDFLEVSELIERMARRKDRREWSASEIACEAAAGRILQKRLGNGSERSQSTRMGGVLSAMIGKFFDVELRPHEKAVMALRAKDNGTGKKRGSKVYWLEESAGPAGRAY